MRGTFYFFDINALLSTFFCKQAWLLLIDISPPPPPFPHSSSSSSFTRKHSPKHRGTQPGPSIIYKGKVIKQMQSGGKKSPKAQPGAKATATAGGQVVEGEHCKCSGVHT